MKCPVAKPLLKIGEIASISGLSVKTIRYYEEIGLLAPTVARSQSGYRLFNDQISQRLSFIKRAQSLGLTLTEIKTILQVHDGGKLPCDEVKNHLQDKVDLITQQIEALESLRTELQSILAEWREFSPSQQVLQTICPNLQGNTEAE